VTVNITSPTTTTFATGANVSVSATASTTGGNISKVEFIVDGTVVATVTSAPYTHVLTGLGAGSHSVEVKATDSNGKTGIKSITLNFSMAFPKVSVAPTIDGNVDALWDSIEPTTLTKSIAGTVSGNSDLSGHFKAVWDNNYLYVLGNITDDNKSNDSPEAYNDDAVEVYVDINNDKPATYATNDVQYTFGYNDGVTISANPSGRQTTGISYATTAKSDGYIFEARIPWSTLQGTPAVGQAIGFEFMVNDDDAGGERDGKLAWTASTDNAWQNPSVFGSATLGDVVTDVVDEEIANVALFPNPYNSSFRLENIQNIESVEILDAQGRNLEVINGKHASLELGTTYAKGLYFVKLKYANKSTTLKVVKQ
ncbi:MAG TPA: sugar-binding protein, partial [Cytophagales bacterium]|nr:sugar-binding protein [Cytophagales bacterium]